MVVISDLSMKAAKDCMAMLPPISSVNFSPKCYFILFFVSILVFI